MPRNLSPLRLFLSVGFIWAIMVPSAVQAAKSKPPTSTPWTADYIRLDPFVQGQPTASTIPTGIDDRGEVLINVVTDSGYGPPFLWSRGTIMTMRQFTPGAAGGAVFAISPHGRFILTSNAVLKRGGSEIGVTGMSGLTGVNDSGQVSGSVQFDGIDYPAVWKNGKAIQLLPYHGFAYGINDSGQVVGGAFMGPGQPEHAFVWRAGKATDIGAHIGRSCGSVATAVAGNGQVAGEYSCGSGSYTAYLWSHKHIERFNSFSDCPQEPTIWSANSLGDVLGGDCDRAGLSFQWLVAWFHPKHKEIRLSKLAPAAQNPAWYSDIPTFINDREQIAADEVEEVPGNSYAETAVMLSPRRQHSTFLSVESSTISSGAQDVMAGTGFTPKSKLELVMTCMMRACSGSEHLAALSVDGEGNFWAQTVAIPSNLPPGRYRIQAMQGKRDLAHVSVSISP